MVTKAKNPNKKHITKEKFFIFWSFNFLFGVNENCEVVKVYEKSVARFKGIRRFMVLNSINCEKFNTTKQIFETFEKMRKIKNGNGKNGIRIKF